MAQASPLGKCENRKKGKSCAHATCKSLSTPLKAYQIGSIAVDCLGKHASAEACTMVDVDLLDH